ncbi:hypothetical protein GCM10010468_33950 [Actinocorallia longicatena]|uniref:NAD(P)-binding protein n=1 Tax=Actinocorallia longicatena TaxID=111803 RepID=A0ABP6QCC4_9ACTN
MILHLASDTRRMGRDDLRQVRTLLATARPDAHLVYISIAGIDGHPYPYFRVKREAERLIAARPHTILRATQWHGFVAGFFDLASKGPALVVPARTPVTPVAAEEVATRLAGLAQGPPRGRVADFGGPETLDVAVLARAYLAAAGRRRPVLGVPVPGRIGRAFREGAHAAVPHAGRTTFAEYLAGRGR